jgi:hypothetical protein
MAKVLERQEMLYDQDLPAWAEQQAEHLRAGQLDRLDLEHLIEQLEAVAGSLRRKLKNRLRILLAHLLKWQYQPRRRLCSWLATIADKRDQIAGLLEENPSLRSELEPAARAAYSRAPKRAAIETGLPRATFPGDLPWDLGHIMGEEGDPDGP